MSTSGEDDMPEETRIVESPSAESTRTTRPPSEADSAETTTILLTSSSIYSTETSIVTLTRTRTNNTCLSSCNTAVEIAERVGEQDDLCEDKSEFRIAYAGCALCLEQYSNPLAVALVKEDLGSYLESCNIAYQSATDSFSSGLPDRTIHIDDYRRTYANQPRPG